MRPTLEPIKHSLQTRATPSAIILGRWRCDIMYADCSTWEKVGPGLCVYSCDPSEWAGCEGPSRQLSLVFVFGIDVVMMNIPIPVRQ